MQKHNALFVVENVHSMVGRRFWYRVSTGEKVPVEASEDLCLPLFDKPRLFGMHEEMLDEACDLGADASDHMLVSLAVGNGWTLVDAAHDRVSPKVIAPSEAQARIAIRRLQLHFRPSYARVEILDRRLGDSRNTFEIDTWSIQRFLEGTPLQAFQQDD